MGGEGCIQYMCDWRGCTCAMIMIMGGRGGGGGGGGGGGLHTTSVAGGS